MVFAYFFAISPRKCFRKIRFLSGLVFCLVLSVLGSGWRFSVRFCFFSSSSFFFPLSPLGAGSGFVLSFSCLPGRTASTVAGRSGLRHAMPCLFFLVLFSLPGPAPLSLALLFSFFLSFFLSFSCKHASCHEHSQTPEIAAISETRESNAALRCKGAIESR